MRRVVVVVVLAGVIFLAGSVVAQQRGASADESQLLALENRWVMALQKHDIPALTSILSDGYVDGDEHGQATDKQGVLAAVRSGDLKFDTLTINGMKANVYGDAAVVTGKAHQVGSYKTEKFADDVVFTDTFVKRNGTWQAVASQRAPTK
jgi:hypothetical protein